MPSKVPEFNARGTQHQGSGNRVSVDPHVPEAWVDLARHGRCLTPKVILLLCICMSAEPAYGDMISAFDRPSDEYGDRRMATLSIVYLRSPRLLGPVPSPSPLSHSIHDTTCVESLMMLMVHCIVRGTPMLMGKDGIIPHPKGADPCPAEPKQDSPAVRLV